jgi:hypothetical protein
MRDRARANTNVTAMLTEIELHALNQPDAFTYSTTECRTK